MTVSSGGAGLGLRRGMFSSLRRHRQSLDETLDFVEVAPENWIDVGGRFGEEFESYLERFPLYCHGLSLNLGGPGPLDISFLKQVRAFLDRTDAPIYTEHLSASGDFGHLYDLMPIPFTHEAVKYVSQRIRTVQDVVERPFGVEHVSYYAVPGPEMSEVEFINEVLEEADCKLLLDVNNIYVNSVNFDYDPLEFLRSMPGERIAYIHIAGHREHAQDLLVDTHGSQVIRPVWDLLEEAYRCFGVRPTLLERDSNFPSFEDLLAEVNKIKDCQRRAKVSV